MKSLRFLLNPFRLAVPRKRRAGRTDAMSAQGIEIASAVNFTARSWRLDPFTPEAYGASFPHGASLSTGYLWDKVRVEGGAYGGMAMMSVAHPVFSCASYRDPNLTATLRHFEKRPCIGRAGRRRRRARPEHYRRHRPDRPAETPAQPGFGETLDRLCGYTLEARQNLRDAMLNATPEKLRKVAEKILDTEESAVAVLGSAAAFDGAEKEGLKFERESLIIQ